MSTQEVKQKAKETWKNVKEMLSSAEKTVQKQIEKTTPTVSHTLDTSFDKASKGFSETLGTIDKRTRREQLALLKGYRSFLQNQIDYIDGRLKAMANEPQKTETSEKQ